MAIDKCKLAPVVKLDQESTAITLYAGQNQLSCLFKHFASARSHDKAASPLDSSVSDTVALQPAIYLDSSFSVLVSLISFHELEIILQTDNINAIA